MTMNRINKAVLPVGLRLKRYDYKPGENGIGRVYYFVDADSGAQVGEDLQVGAIADLTLSEWVKMANDRKGAA